MTHLASERERTVLLCMGVSDRAKVWLNGRSVFEWEEGRTYHLGPEWLVPVTLRPGHNTLLVRVSHSRGGHSLRLRSDDFELDRAYFLAEFGRWPEALNELDQADARGQFHHPFPLARQVELMASLGQRERYLRAAERLADFEGMVRPDPGETAHVLGLMPHDLISSDRLIRLARRGAEANPADPWKKRVVALAEYRAGRYREAIDELKGDWPNHEFMEAPIRAMAHWRLGEQGEARKALARCDENFAEWWRARSSGRENSWVNWWLDGAQQPQLRREAHQLIDRTPPNDERALQEIRTTMGNLLDARDLPTWAYDLAWRLGPEDNGIRLAYAARLIELGRMAEAEKLLADMPEKKTDQPNGLVGRGLLLAQANQPDRAAALFARALDLASDNPSVFSDRPRLCRKMLAQDLAYERLMALRPREPLLWYIRAEQSLDRRDWSRAIANFIRGGEPPATTEFAYEYACALLLSGESPRYRR
jgi:tetratricopeptide (TPR) repeat protein